jgi:hypothetical protein
LQIIGGLARNTAPARSRRAGSVVLASTSAGSSGRATLCGRLHAQVGGAGRNSSVLTSIRRRQQSTGPLGSRCESRVEPSHVNSPSRHPTHLARALRRHPEYGVRYVTGGRPRGAVEHALAVAERVETGAAVCAPIPLGPTPPNRLGHRRCGSVPWDDTAGAGRREHPVDGAVLRRARTTAACRAVDERDRGVDVVDGNPREERAEDSMIGESGLHR